MSKLLIDEHPLQVLPSLAVAIGLNEAIILQQIHYWLKLAERGNSIDKYHSGKWWVYNSYEQWQVDNFPFWSVSTIGRVVRSLEKAGLIISRKIKSNQWDHRKWYTINYETLKVLECNDRSCQNDTIGTGQNDTILQETTTETTTDTKDSTAGAVQPPQPDGKKATRPRDLLFDAIAEHSFGIKPGTTIGAATAKRIGMVKKEIATFDPPVEPDEYRLACVAYQRQKITPARDPVKVLAMLNEHRNKHDRLMREVPPAPPAPDDGVYFPVDDYRRVDSDGNWIGETA